MSMRRFQSRTKDGRTHALADDRLPPISTSLPQACTNFKRGDIKNLVVFTKNVEKSGGVWGNLCIFDIEISHYYIQRMLMRFVGNIEAKADAKGRVFFPSVFRKLLSAAGEERLIMRKDIFQPCLVLYPESVWTSNWTCCAAGSTAGTPSISRFSGSLSPTWRLSGLMATGASSFRSGT